MGSVVHRRAAKWSTFFSTRFTAILIGLSVATLLAPAVQATSFTFPDSEYNTTGNERWFIAVDSDTYTRGTDVSPLFQDDGSWQQDPEYTDPAAATWEPTWEPTWEESNQTWEPTAGESTEYVESTPDWETTYVEPTDESGDGQTWEEPTDSEGAAYEAQPTPSNPDWRNTHWAQGPGQIQGTWKEIVVSISDQYLWAYEGGELVTSSLVSTGTAEVPATVTPIGYHTIIAKYDKQTMEGTISGEFYRVEDVPYVMYFDDLGNALHGTYWHNNFGSPMSHGCVNLPIDIAAFVYEWAPYGTAVTVIS
jgi:hypothetical protein